MCGGITEREDKYFLGIEQKLDATRREIPIGAGEIKILTRCTLNILSDTSSFLHHNSRRDRSKRVEFWIDRALPPFLS